MIRVLSFLILLFILTGIIGFLPNLSNMYILILPLALLYCLFKTLYLKISISMLVLIIFCALSIIVGRPLSLFRSWQRLSLFILVCSVISPLFEGDSFIILRRILFASLIRVCIVIVVLSFIAYFLGVNYMKSGDYFGGITNHSMILAPVASISFISSLVIFYRSSIKKVRYLYVFLAVISLLCVLLSASRSALVGVLCSGLMIVIFENRKSLKKMLLSLCMLIILTLVSFPLWRPYASDLILKQNANVEMGGSGFYSRETKWKARKSEFKSNPIFGVGFSAIDIHSGDFYNPQNGQIEPGTSWGGILSMVGIMGLIPILYMFFMNFYCSIKMAGSNYIQLIIAALLLFYSIHLVAEGYIFGSGGFLFFTLWLTLGIATDYRKINY